MKQEINTDEFQLKTVEFCLLVEEVSSINGALLANGLAELVSRAFLPGSMTEFNTDASVDDANESSVKELPKPKNHLEATACCIDDHHLSRDHSKHHIIIRVPPDAIRSYAALLRPDIPPDSLAMTSLLNNLTYGQMAWLCDLIIRSAHFPSNQLQDFINNLIGKNDSELTKWKCSADGFKAFAKKHKLRTTGNLILCLQRINLVSELVVCHDPALRASLQRSLLGFDIKCKDRTPCETSPESGHDVREFKRRLIFPDVAALRRYLGDGIGIYFAWMQSYVTALMVLTIMGILLWISCGNVPRPQEIVEDTAVEVEMHEETLALPLKRPHVRLPIERVIFGLATVVWALVCAKLWRRHRATKASNWTRGTLMESTLTWQLCSRGYGDLRAQFRGAWRCSRVTGSPELHYPASRRRLRYLVTGLITFLCLSVAIAVNVMLMNLEGYIHPSRSAAWLHIACLASWAAPGAPFDPNSGFWLAMLPGVLHPLMIYFMNQILFRRIAEALTDWENHKTRRAHEQALVIKRFLFEAVDAYACLAYLGLILGDWLALQQLLINMFATDTVRRITQECIVPWISYRLRTNVTKHQVGRAKKLDSASEAPAEDQVKSLPSRLVRQREMCADSYEEFDDYLEMVLEQGYLVLFATALPPIVPVLALLCTWAEAHFDAFKLVWVTRRPEPRPLPPVSINSGATIGGGRQPTDTWLMLLQIQAWIGILTNVGLIVTSWYGGSLSALGCDADTSWWWWGAILEHVLIAVGLAIEFGVSNVPIAVREQDLAEMYHANKRLAAITP